MSDPTPPTALSPPPPPPEADGAITARSATTGPLLPAGYGWLPWALHADYAPCPTPHPGGLGPVPVGGGGRGYLNTADGGLLAHCRSDLDAVSVWLGRHLQSPMTRTQYQHEIERYLLWLGIERGKALAEATPDDVMLYEQLLRSPEQWPHWYGPECPRNDPRWRPFSKPLEGRSRYQALQVVSRCYRYLVEQGYLRLNPVAGATHLARPPRRAAVQECFLDEGLWHEVGRTLAELPQQTATQQARYHRARWVLSALYVLLARASEFAQARMGDLYRVRRPHAEQWWWRVKGKHRRPEDAADHVPVPSSLIGELARYREHLGLPPYPAAEEETPMVVSLYPQRDGWQPVHRTTIYRIVKSLFLATAERIAADHPAGAETLRHASTHWLRHSGITHRLDHGWSLKETRAASRHASLQSLSQYVHADRDRLAEQAEQLDLGWGGNGLDH
ncbi:tyrosine-type recombinase/integrase [Halorhodospira abdelmalekii]|uniref:tyrosine-type recombinase/integrase n=1 Tax=Halorhodospira abdelmalekii TaxID=421629 RepID=UPI001908806D|nr:site-specific integrase [Halorhodospira abdelmalekii]